MLSSLLRRPAAFVPLGLSSIALAMVLVHAAVFGVVREADEGTAAHIFQLLLAIQGPFIAFFAVAWLPRAPRQALNVLALQVGAATAALVAAHFLT